MRLVIFLRLALLLIVSSPAMAQYEVPVVLPECDYIIKDVSGWAKINNPLYNVFCVVPAVYTYADIGVVTLKQSGTAQKQRYLRWYDPSNPKDVDTHVMDIPVEKQAVIPQFSIKGNYWVIDRMIMREGRSQNILDEGAAHNILNRILIEGGTSTLLLQFFKSAHNILQHSVIRNTIALVGKDSYAIYFHESEGERIVDNEIYNYGGGIQQAPSSLNNHIVYGNEMYITDELYTDCNGLRNRSGSCMCSEGFAVVLKGVDRPGTNFRIENNLIYGHKRTDEKCMGSGGAQGEAINLGSGGGKTHNVIISGNILLNRVRYNIYLGKQLKDIEISNNVIGYGRYGIANVYGENVVITDNDFINNAKDYHTGPLAKGTIYKNNRKMKPAEEAGRCFLVQKFTNPHTACIPQLH